MGSKQSKPNEMDLHTACTQLLADERFRADRREYCAGESIDDEAQWQATEEALPIAVAGFRAAHGRDAILAKFGRIIDQEGAALFDADRRLLPALAFSAAAAISFSLFYFGLQTTHPAVALAVSMVPLVITSVCCLSLFQPHKALDRFEERLGSLRTALDATVTAHEEALNRAASDLAQGPVTGQDVAKLQLLQETGQTSADTIQSIGKNLAANLQTQTGDRLTQLAEMAVAAIALGALGTVGHVLTHAGPWAAAQIASVLLGGASLVFFARRHSKQVANGKASLIEHIFGVNRLDAQSPATALRGQVDFAALLAAIPDPQETLANAETDTGSDADPVLAEPSDSTAIPVRSMASPARDIHRLRLAAAPTDSHASHMPRAVWEA